MAVSFTTLAQINIASGGTRQKLSAGSLAIVKVYISAPSGNSGNVYIGDVAVAAGRGIEVPKGTTLVIEAPHGDLMDLNTMYVDGTTNDKINVVYMTNLSRSR